MNAFLVCLQEPNTGKTLVWALVGMVAIFGSLLVIKLLSPVAGALKEEELGQTRQGEQSEQKNYDDDYYDFDDDDD